MRDSAAMNVLVLLSTFNGVAFLRQQVDSILNQTLDEGTLSLLVRDDASRDQSIATLEDLHDPRIDIMAGSHIGAKESYLNLLAAARNRDADYIALADQDDVWLAGKLQRAIDQLRSIKGPALYCSALSLVDAQLRPLDRFAYPGTPNFEAAFLTNCVTGCTCVVNRELLGLLPEMPRSGEILMHDWWLYLVAVSFGTVIYDHESRILYRQHDANQVGRRKGAAHLINRGRKFLRRPHHPHRLSQAREFERLYGAALTAAQRRYLAGLVACEGHPLMRVRFAFQARAHGLRGLDDAVGLTGFLLGG
jgi:glycosyltransferase involved in cell wall biosynthesis